MSTVKVKALDTVSDGRLTPTFLTTGKEGTCSEAAAKELQEAGFVKIVGKAKESQKETSDTKKEKVSGSTDKTRSFVNGEEKKSSSITSGSVNKTKTKNVGRPSTRTTKKKGSDLA